MDDVTKVADAILYEGYLLWPYRRSALKNRQRWTFGGVHPESWPGETDPSIMETQCLVEGNERTRVSVTVRFLHVVERKVVNERMEGVDELTVGGERYLSWDEATERRVDVVCPGIVPIDVPAGMAVERIGAGALLRSWRALHGTVEVACDRLRPGLHRLTVRIANRTPWHGGTRDDVLRQTFVSTHTILHAAAGEFVSLMDPPPEFRDEATACRNTGTWPVLAGPEGDRHAMLSSPIILYDWPRVAPESPGDLFDATEIDQLLVLSVLSLSDEEQREMRSSDPRAAAILDRCAALSAEELMRLHGAIRDLRPLREG